MSGLWNEPLPTELEVGGGVYGIRWDYRAILDICAAFSDPELDGQDRATVALEIFYPGLEIMPPEDYPEAVERFLWFLNAGVEERGEPTPPLLDWEQDFPLLVSPVNRVLGREIRNAEPLHWWTFLSAYYEIGDCLFAQVIRIRDRQARGKTLDKQDMDFYRRNRALVDRKTRYTERETAVLDRWLHPTGGEKRA